MSNNIKNPKELFEVHEDWVHSNLIPSEKQSRIAEVLNDFSSTLYSRILVDKKLGSKFYTSEVRGFTLKMISVPTVGRTIAFDDVYVGIKSGIGPIFSNSVTANENREIIKWLDSNLRKYLYDRGWYCGILRDRESFGDRIVIYEVRKKLW